jgi:hypothetical protein
VTKKSFLWMVHFRFRKIPPLENFIEQVVKKSLLWKVHFCFLKITPLENFIDQVVKSLFVEGSFPFS